MGPVFSGMWLCMLWVPLCMEEHSGQAEKSWIIQPFVLSLTKTRVPHSSVEPWCLLVHFLVFFFHCMLDESNWNWVRAVFCARAGIADVHVPVQNSEGKPEGGLGLKAGGHHACGGISGVSLLDGRCMWRAVEVLTSSRVRTRGGNDHRDH